MIDESTIQKLYRYASALSNNDDLAYDLVHDALIRVQGRFLLDKETYLKRCIRNRFYDLRKDRHRYEERDLEETPKSVNFEDVVLAKDEIHFFLKDAPAEERELLYLVFVENLSYKEAAKLTKTKIGTVMSRLHRCKARLRKKRTAHGE